MSTSFSVIKCRHYCLDLNRGIIIASVTAPQSSATRLLVQELIHADLCRQMAPLGQNEFPFRLGKAIYNNLKCIACAPLSVKIIFHDRILGERLSSKYHFFL